MAKLAKHINITTMFSSTAYGENSPSPGLRFSITILCNMTECENNFLIILKLALAILPKLSLLLSLAANLRNFDQNRLFVMRIHKKN